MILILKHKWFDMIASGEKKEEYRLNTSRMAKMVANWTFKHGFGKRVIDFRRGYTKTSCKVRCNGIHSVSVHNIGNHEYCLLKPEWGYVKGKPLIVFELGEADTVML